MPNLFIYCLNTSTVQAHKLPLPQLVDLTADAGYGAIEPWIGEIESYRNAGGSLKDLAKRIADRGLKVASAIGFAAWLTDDETERAKQLEIARRDMDLVAQIGGSLIAAPPMGYQDRTDLNLHTAAERYAALFDIGQQIGVTPLVEVWGFSKSLNKLGEAAFIAIESGRPGAAILADVYHLFKGGSPISGLRLLNGKHLPLFHMNDYPSQFTRQAITDADRVYPGDGVAPLRDILDTLREIGAAPFLSLELFNKEYWKQDPMTIATTGLAKMKRVVEA